MAAIRADQTFIRSAPAAPAYRMEMNSRGEMVIPDDANWSRDADRALHDFRHKGRPIYVFPDLSFDFDSASRERTAAGADTVERSPRSAYFRQGVAGISPNANFDRTNTDRMLELAGFAMGDYAWIDTEYRVNGQGAQSRAVRFNRAAKTLIGRNMVNHFFVSLTMAYFVAGLPVALLMTSLLQD
ncbi:hypothetical protein ACDA63_03975 [Uliginosibacterium sp. sgz301328]|uniref:hypothetical protein n=1 Tax=Uliginosibacterium sp. sgz301328 TaxID=3243764 RepID=UPI00359D3C75